MAKDIEINASDMVKKAIYKRRHLDFQFGDNPMQMTEFERRQANMEAEARDLATKRYVNGLQGIDGGKTGYEDTKDATLPLNFKRHST